MSDNINLDVINSKLEKLLYKDKLIELMKTIVPVLTALIGALAALFGSYLTYSSKQEEMADDRVLSMVQLANDGKLTEASVESITKIADAMGIEAQDAPLLGFLQALVRGNSSAVEEVTKEVIASNPGAIGQFIENASQLSSKGTEGMQAGIEGSPLPEEQKKSLREQAQFSKLIDDIEHSPDRLNAMVRLREEWQKEPDFVKTLIDACKGRVQVQTEYGINVRIINTMDILRRCNVDVLQQNEPIIRIWLETEILGRVGPNTTTMAKSLLKRLDELDSVEPS